MLMNSNEYLATIEQVKQEIKAAQFYMGFSDICFVQLAHNLARNFYRHFRGKFSGK